MDSNSADKKCCVRNCGKSRSDGVILHAFPHHDKDSNRFRSWLYAIGGNILGLDHQKIFKYRKVCHIHFEPKFHTSSKRLAANAIPTLNMPGVQQRMALMNVTNRDVTNVQVESSSVQSQPSFVHNVGEPQPSASIDKYSVAYVTVPDIEKGKMIGHGLVKNKLAACVNVIPQITSIYEWEGKINEDSEALLMIKTRTSQVDKLTEFVRSNHPYTVCEVISLPIKNGNPPYLKWIGETVPENECSTGCN